MKEDAIAEMKAFDWDEFKHERRFCEHNQYFEGYEFFSGDGSDLGDHPLHDRFFDSFAAEDNYFADRRYGWIDQLDDEELIKAVKS